MRLGALLTALLVASLVLAGCSGKDKDKDDDSDTSSPSSSSRSSSSSTTGSSSTSSTSSSSTSTSSSPTNTAPVGSITATVTAGGFPKQVNFTLNGTDPDGDNFVWDFDFADGNTTNGSTLPQNLTHNYTAAGLYNVTFSITDGRLSSSYNVTVNVTAGGGATLFAYSEATAVPANPALSGLPVLGSDGAEACGACAADMSGGDCVFTEIEAALAGKAFTAVSDGANADLEFWDSCDWVMGAPVALYTNDGPEADVVPAGAGCVILWDSDAPATLTFTVTG